MMPSLPYAVLLFASVLLASCAGKRAFAVGMVITAVWVSYNAAWWWPSASPAALAYLAGVEMTHAEAWALTDLLAVIVIIPASGYRWWGFALAGVLLMQMVAYALIEAGAAFAPSSIVLDALFLAQLAVLFMVGGKHRDRLLLSLRGILHRLRRSIPQAQCSGG